ncbi:MULTISPECIES: bifunctional 3-(3-hydroxy-phenyl)propionate/3-hydroxycinnamic acid hydroxylase [Bhargavaea]|uniref:Bifunctional 3-(3-hydroxy-phenyl)propionate/3-hydroxycinnamic acid hydroxylase n=1 Tax=Bhargavaea changchunensis TaxID=2134037 RepID=A0ABW2NDP8_9BACL|nr:bifunctional 3-(3-hydroxy-phenyl)propionate/3-hydroxycinnamic acid hydroxylase [Bhargavaea sp. CC-171006]
MTNTHAYDVIVIGYGPVGKMVSALLGQKGWNVGVFERYDRPYGLPRAVKYDHEITRLLQKICPVEDIQRISVKVPDNYVWCNADRVPLLEIDWSQDGISGWPADMLFNQAELETIMNEACESLPSVDINLGYNAIHLNEHEDQVNVLFKSINGEVINTAAKYVIGCDGANSFVRDNMEHTITDLGFYNDFLIVDIIPTEDMEFKPMNLQVCDPKRPTTCVSGGPGRRRWEFMLLPGETKEEFKSEEVAWDLLKSWGIHPGNAKMERHAVYTFKAKWVDQWRKNRLFLAGDAAHLTPPFMGQGMSSGIRDAANLAWKMDLLLKGVTDDSILDTYTEERKPHMEKLIEAAIYLGKIICTTDVERAKQRDEQFLSGNFPPFPAFPTLTEGVFDRSGSEKEAGLTGHLSPQGIVEHNGQSGLFDNVVGQGWVLMGWNHDPKEGLTEQQIQMLEDIGAVFAKVVPKAQPEPAAVIDTDGTYEAFFRTNGIEVALFRPDFYIYGVRGQKEELPTLIQGLSEQLTQQTNLANAR